MYEFTVNLTLSEIQFIRIAARDYIDKYANTTYPQTAGWDKQAHSVFEKCNSIENEVVEIAKRVIDRKHNTL